jgi:hypothetical protein
MILCGDGFMDFIHRPKSKILKLKIKITTFRKLALLPCSGGWRGRREGPTTINVYNYAKMLSVLQQCFCGKFMSPATMKFVPTSSGKKLCSN